MLYSELSYFASTGKTALFYNYGICGDFRENEPNNAYVGYYYKDYNNDKEDGIEIVNSNGKSTKTDWLRCENAEEAIAIIS